MAETAEDRGNGSGRALTAVGPTYERFVFGYTGISSSGASELRKAFIHASHSAPARCVATAGAVCATGGSDDLIRVLHMHQDAPVDLGAFVSAGGSPSSLAFTHTGRHLLSGATDGTLELLSAYPQWHHLSLLHGHQSRITSITPHPTGILTLSASSDRGFRLWDLRTAKCVAKHKLREPVHAATFLPSGKKHCVLGASTTCISDTERGIEVLALRTPQRPLCLSSWSEHCVAVGCEAGSFCLLDYRVPSTHALSVDRLHPSRLKGVCPFAYSSSVGVVISGAADEPSCLVSASTDGTVRVFDTRKLTNHHGAPTFVSECTGAGRFTGLALVLQHQYGDHIPPSVGAMERPGAVSKEQNESLEAAQKAEEMLDKAWREYKESKAKRRRQLESGYNPDKADDDDGAGEAEETEKAKALKQSAKANHNVGRKKKQQHKSRPSGAAAKQQAFKQKAKVAMQQKRSRLAKARSGTSSRQGLPRGKRR